MITQRVMLGISICGVILSIFVSCTSTSPISDVRVIFPERRAEKMGIGTWFALEADIGGYWTPTEEDILTLEGKLDSFYVKTLTYLDASRQFGNKLTTTSGNMLV